MCPGGIVSVVFGTQAHDVEFADSYGFSLAGGFDWRDTKLS